MSQTPLERGGRIERADPCSGGGRRHCCRRRRSRRRRSRRRSRPREFSDKWRMLRPRWRKEAMAFFKERCRSFTARKLLHLSFGSAVTTELFYYVLLLHSDPHVFREKLNGRFGSGLLEKRARKWGGSDQGRLIES